MQADSINCGRAASAPRERVRAATFAQRASVTDDVERHTGCSALVMHAHATSAFKTIRDHLVEEHRRLEDLFDQFLDAFEAGEHQPFVDVWTRFETDLLRHFDFEERFLIPQFQRSDREAAAAILMDRCELTHRLAELSIGVDVHVVRLTPARHFIGLLREHANRVDDLMYRWSDAQCDENERASMLRALEPRNAPPLPLEQIGA